MTARDIGTAVRSRVSSEVNAGRKDLRAAGRGSHRNRVLPKCSIYGQHEGRPPDVRLLDHASEAGERGLRHESVKLIDEVVDKRNAGSPGLPNSGEGVEEAQSHEDVRPEFSELMPNLEPVSQ